MSTSLNVRVNFRLKLPYNIKMSYKTYFINLNYLYYRRLLLRENDEVLAIPVVDSGHLGCRKFFSDFRTSLISLAISFLR